jgi:hypothetical protein
MAMLTTWKNGSSLGSLHDTGRVKKSCEMYHQISVNASGKQKSPLRFKQDIQVLEREVIKNFLVWDGGGKALV